MREFKILNYLFEMFEFLLLLSYRIDVYEPYTFLTSLDELTYGFNKNAYYELKFSNIQTQMIFGLATQKEMRKIEEKSYPQLPCILNNFSKIQYLILFDSTISYHTEKKEVLTPYFYKCANYIQATLDIEIDNGFNNLDYRLQNVLIFLIMITCITFIYLIVFSVFSCCIRSKFPINSFIFILISLIITFIAQDLIGIFFYFSIDDMLFLQQYFKDREFFADGYQIVSSGVTMISLVLVLIYCFMQYLNYKKMNNLCCSFVLLFIPTSCLIAMIIFMLIYFELASYIISSCMLLLFSCIVIFMPPILSLVKLGLAFYLIGVLLSAPGVSILIYLIEIEDYVNLAVLDLSIIFIVFQILSLICLFFVFWSKKMNGDNQSMNQSLIQSNISYTNQNSGNNQQNKNNNLYFY